MDYFKIKAESEIKCECGHQKWRHEEWKGRCQFSLAGCTCPVFKKARDAKAKSLS